MAKVKIQGNASGTGVLTVTAPNTSTDRTITLPDSTGTLVDDTTAVTKDSNNNVGIGVTPESWNSGWNTLQIGDGASIAGRTASGNVDISSNAYRDSTDNRWEYIGANGSEEAAKYTQFSGQHVFYTAPSGSADAAITFSTKATIDSDGLKFNGDTAEANALDDYEIGTWTPVSITGTASSQSGTYTRIGRFVHCEGSLTFPNQTNSGHVTVGGLPFTINGSESGSRPTGSIRYTAYDAQDLFIHGNPSATTFNLYKKNTGGVSQTTYTDMSSRRFDFNFQFQV